ncbi:MAG: hypothetical protein SGPRY_014167, partial [Prymnesium sp.]
MTFVLLGSRAALARQFASKAGKHVCLSVSRHSDADATIDLQHATHEQLLRAAAVLRTLAPGGSELTVFLFATTYTYDGDIAIAKRSVQLCRLLRARRLVYLSSWVVALEGGMNFPYRRAKLECEQLIDREWEGESVVVRVSNVYGSPELLQQRMLDQLGTLLPRSCMRCYIHVDDACAALLEAATAPHDFGSEQMLYSAYGRRQCISDLLDDSAAPRPPLPFLLGAALSLEEQVSYPFVSVPQPAGLSTRHNTHALETGAHPHDLLANIEHTKFEEQLQRVGEEGGARIGLGLLSSPLRRALLFFTRLLLYVCIAILSHVHVYFKGWYRAGVFAPSTERELRSFFNHRANKAVVVGNGAIVSIFGYRTRDHIVVSTANLQQVAEVQVTWASSVLTYLLPRERLRPSTQEDGTVRLQAGTTFKIALRELRSQNRSLALLPNYSHVTLGAALAVPLHGMNAAAPTMAAVVERMSLIDLRNSRHVQPNGKEEVAKWMHLQPGTVLYLSADVRTEAVTHFTLRKTTLSRARAGECVYTALARQLSERRDKRVE